MSVCSFEAVDMPRGRKLTYATFKAAVLKAGRFSVFEATETAKKAQWFDSICRDPDVEIVPEPFPWTGVRRKPAPPSPPQEPER